MKKLPLFVCVDKENSEKCDIDCPFYNYSFNYCKLFNEHLEDIFEYHSKIGNLRCIDCHKLG